MFTPRRISLSSLLFPLALALFLVLAVCSALYIRDSSGIAADTLDLETRRMDRFTGVFSHEVAGTISDLRVLASGDGFETFLSTGQQADLNQAVRRAVYFSKDNPDYDKVRYLDERGQEVFRVNQNGAIVPTLELQNKGNQPFFRSANALGPDEIYVSTIDLDIENNVVEQPFKPTFRVAMPVFDVSGRRRGVYVIDFLAANSIERLRAFVPRYRQRFRLLNDHGDWLAGPKPEAEWNFEFPERSGLSLAKTDPDLWAQILKQPTGQVPYHGGYFTWSRASPRDFYPGKPVKLVAQDDFLVFASQVSADEWTSSFARLRQTFVVVGLMLTGLTTLLIWIFQARLKANQERDRFFNLTRDMLCVAGFDGYFKRVNPAWSQALGYTSEEMTAKPFLDFVHPEDRQKTVDQTSTLSRGGEVISFENRYRCKDGSYRWLMWSARSLVGEQLIYASARDLTERKQIEQTLRVSEERSRSIIEGAHDGFISIDLEGRITDWNIKAEEIFGRTKAEVVGRYLHETIIPPKYREAHVAGMRHLRSTGEGPVLNKTIELSGLRRNGREFPLELVIWPLQRGDETTFHAFVRDITGRKEAAERIEKLNSELKQRADLLQTANKELESFSYSVSHDLRAPLRHIHGFVELLEKVPALEKEPSAQRYMKVISRAAKEMGLLIDDLLAFSRTGRVEMNPVKIDMNRMVAQIIRDMEIDVQGRVVQWDVKPMAAASGDTGLIRLVWANLLGNAVKYTRPRAEAKIEIGELPTEPGKPGPPETVYYVRDNGVGFDMQYASKLFGVFQRLHRSEDFEGTGIGLANVQRIVHRHGGRVWAEAKVESGATFYFSLPATTPTPSNYAI